MSLQHITGIHERGVAALRTGEVNPYPGHGENLREFFGCALRFSPESLNQVQERVLDPTLAVSNSLDLEVLVYNTEPNQSSPIHSTLHVGKWNGEEKQRETAFVELASNLSAFENDVQGQNIVFDFVALDKANVFIACKEIPSIVSLLRRHMVEICNVSNISGDALPLLHSVVSRITALPEDQEKKAQALQTYISLMLGVKASIEERPLVLEVSGLWAGEVYQFLTEGVT